MSNEPERKLVKLATMARLLGVVPETVRAWVASGKIPAYKVPSPYKNNFGGERGTLRFDVEEVREAIRVKKEQKSE